MKRFLLFILLAATVHIAKAQAPTFPEALNPFPGCAGSSTFIVVSYGGGQATSTLWEFSANGGVSWNTITENAQYSIITNAPGNFRLGGRGAWLNINYLTPDMEHYQYRLTLSNASGSNVSDPATLYVATAPPPQPVFDNPPTSVCAGQTVLFKLAGDYSEDSIYWGNTVLTWGQTSLPEHFDITGTASVEAYVFNGCGRLTASASVTVNPLQSSLAGTAGGGSVCSNLYAAPGFTTRNSDGSCDPMAALLPSGANPVSGNIQNCVTVDASVQTFGGIPYVPRHYSMEPSSGGATSTATVTLYFTQGDFDAYNAARGSNPALPMNSSDAAGIANLHVTQFHGTGTTPDTYAGGSGDIDPDDNNIIWNAAASRWEVTFDITGFSGFFVSGSSILPLPLTLTDFSGKETKAGNQLYWTTSIEENTAYFEVEREAAANAGFVSVGKVLASGNSNQTVQYDYTDVVTGDALYRLKMVDIDGKFTYSRIVALTSAVDALTIRVLPNPAHQALSLTVGSPAVTGAVLTVTDMSGKKMAEKHLSLQKGNNSIDPGILEALPQGMYLIGVATDKQQQTMKFVKD
ncbi:MAG TPA: T9SS type A sorting domain-containing protein [Puia sp.]|jgi:hypothetical protein|nr:T9SS type A sorting domain-containing protein [Puia sp.]